VDSKTWHQKIAANRGENWKRNVEIGRRRVQLMPTKLRQIRLALGLHQTDVVSKMKIKLSASAYGRIETGNGPTTKSIAEEICVIIGCELSTVFYFGSRKRFWALR